MRKWRSAALAAAAAAIVLTAGCGSEPAAPDAAGAQPAGQADAAYPEGDGAEKPAGRPAENTPAGQLTIGDTTDLGPVLTDSGGYTLYRFDEDTAEPSRSVCEGDCAETWPAVPAAGVSSTAGIDASLIGKVTRADGTEQLTVAGWPMYRHAKDTKPWQVNGQGKDGTWYAAAPDGKKAAPGTDSGAGGGSGEDLPALSTLDDPELGEILRDGEGRTLYRFTKDSAWPMKSNCVGKCLELWKPAKPVGKADVEGVDAGLLSTHERTDGTGQLAIDCWPLYWYTGDEKPGDANGQGVGGTWFTVTADGKKAENKV